MNCQFAHRLLEVHMHTTERVHFPVSLFSTYSKEQKSFKSQASHPSANHEVELCLSLSSFHT